MRQWLRSALVFLASVTCAWATPAWAGVAQGSLPVQGVLRTSAGGAVADGVYAVTVSLYDQQVGGTMIWKQVLSAVPVVGGLFAFDIGGDPLAAPLPTALTDSPTPLWFAIQIGSDPELPRSAVGWVPRAFWANVAGTAQSVTCSGCIGASQIAIGSIDADKVAFTYAASASAGGPAASALNADTAKDLNCIGCVELSDLAASVTGAYLPITGGSLSGTSSLTVPGTLTVKQVVDFTNAVIIGGRIIGGDACDASHSGAIGWDNISHRFSLCDGANFRKLAYCAESCVAADKTTCGSDILDICGDVCTGAGKGKGTLCSNASQECVNNSCIAVPTSCLAIKNANPSAISGDYLIDPDGVGGEAPTQVYCDMTTSSGVSATLGGWTLVMKIDGTKDTFLYDSAYWTNKIAYNAASFTFGDGTEFKSSAFWTLPFRSVRVLMATGPTAGVNADGAQELQVDGRSLYDIFAGGTHRPTYIGRNGWKSLLGGMTLLYNCNLEGFNVRSQDSLSSASARPRVRIGILTNGENDCASIDSWIGVGEQGNGCGTGALQRATGNGCPNGCGGCDSGITTNITAFTYIYIR